MAPSAIMATVLVRVCSVTALPPAAGEDRPLWITAEPVGEGGQPARILLRRPFWAQRTIVRDAAAQIARVEEPGYLQFEVMPGAPVSATFNVRPRLEDRRFGMPTIAPSRISRHLKIVLSCGPELRRAAGGSMVR
jgi:hypothetical protein